MTKDEIIELARQAWISDQEVQLLTEFDEAYISYTCLQDLETFAKLIEDSIYAKQLELPKPRLTGKFSITMGKFKCTGCTGLWDSSEDAKHHSCRDYQ